MVLEKTLESPWDCKEVQPVHPKGDHVLAIINSAAMNTGVHVSLSDLVSLVCMHRSGIAGSYGSSILNFFFNIVVDFVIH